MKPATQVFKYSLTFRLTLLLNAIVCLLTGIIALVLPWTESFKPTEPSANVTAILVSTLLFLPLAGFFLHRCNQFWGRLEVDSQGITVATLTSRRRLEFDRVVSLTVAGSAGGHELILLTDDSPRETEIITHHITGDEERFMRIIEAALSDLIERQNGMWDEGEMPCEFSPRALREGWYLVAVVNSVAWVMAGTLIWKHHANPLIVTSLIAGAVAALGLTVMIHQRHYNRRYSLTRSGLRVWSVFGNQFIPYGQIRSISLSHRQFYGARFIRCLIRARQGSWALTSNMRDFEGFILRLVRRSPGAAIRGSLSRDSSEQARVLRVRALNAMRFWFVASLVVGLLLAGWGVFSLNQRNRLISKGSVAAGTVTSLVERGGRCWVHYEFTHSNGPRDSDATVYSGQARVSPHDFARFALDDFIEVHYDPNNPNENVCPQDTSYRFNWLFIAMGGVLFGYAGYQMRRLYLERLQARRGGGKQ